MPKTSPKSRSEELKFDPEGHRYFKGKKRIPGVSEILQKVGLTKDYSKIDPFYRDRGVATHLAIRYYLEGRLDLATLDPAIQPQFEAFLWFWKDHSKERILAIEKPLCDSSEAFAGTIDLITEIAIYDWKCTKAHDKAADLQGQGYKTLARENCLGARELPFIVVELHDDGASTEFNYGTACQQWSSVLNLYQWRINHA